VTDSASLLVSEIRRIRRALLAWFRRNAREMPWRRTRDPYRIWVSEIMLQQTRVETVLPYYKRFLKAFPNVKVLASADQDRVLKLWQGLGYYTRARNLQQAAQIVMSERRGRLPRTADEWQTLPGVGRYTAGAIASIAFGERVPVLDGNVKRVLARLCAIEERIDKAATVRRLWSIAETLVPAKNPGAFNQALMELGSSLCTPKVLRCEECPLRGLCRARALGTEKRLPVRQKKKPVPHYEIVAGAIRRNGCYLLGKRPPDALLGGLWEFPGGKVEIDETHEQALVREVGEELGLGIAVGSLVASVRHAYSHFTITLHLYRCESSQGRPESRYHTEVKWVPPSHFDRYAFPAANSKCLDRLLRGRRGQAASSR
jgi:A/G-specific adenine glycosylase